MRLSNACSFTSAQGTIWAISSDSVRHVGRAAVPRLDEDLPPEGSWDIGTISRHRSDAIGPSGRDLFPVPPRDGGTCASFIIGLVI